jgi:hypothetical protein
MEIWEPNPPGTLWATPGLLRHSFTIFNSYMNTEWRTSHLSLHKALSPVETTYYTEAVNVTVVLHTFCTPEIWDRFSDVHADSSLLGYDSVYID